MILVSVIGWCAAALLVVGHLRLRRRLVLVARASHELRGPLCAARLALGGLIGGEPGRVAVIDLELARAGRALDDLAAAPSGTRSPEQAEHVDVAALARAYAPSWRALASAHGAGFRLRLPDDDPDPVPPMPAGGLHRVPVLARAVAGDPATVIPLPPPHRAREPVGGVTVVAGDPLRIVQAVANLVANAAEHGGGVVRVRVRRDGARVRVEVKDDGPGLPAPVAALAEAARGRSGRRGHGLAIAAAIAERHGGRLSALPSGAGARLALDLPAAAVERAARGR
jgi:signal transduction histidine kinase